MTGSFYAAQRGGSKSLTRRSRLGEDYPKTPDTGSPVPVWEAAYPGSTA